MGLNIMRGINNDRGIKQGKLEHIFIGTVKNNGEVSGYHCDKKYGDERVYAEVHLYPKSRRIITYNRDQGIFEAYVRSLNGKLKCEGGGKSTFFNQKWSRQYVVDFIASIDHGKDGKVLKRYKGKGKAGVYIHKIEKLCVVNNVATTYPLLKY